MFTIEQANNNYPNGSGGGGSGGDYPLDATFDTIKVNKEATFDTIKVNKEATFTVDNQDITFANHESRIKTLEESEGGGGSGDNAFSFTSGYPEIMITTNLTEHNDGNNHTLTIDIDKSVYTDYVGDMIGFVLPREFGINDAVKITKQADNTFTCPSIDYNEDSNKYTLTNTPNQTSLFIRFNSLLDYPMSMFTNGDMQIKSIVNQPTLSTSNVIKCNTIDADNAFNLYRSPLPNIYDIREYGKHGVVETYFAYFGFDAGSDEFNQLIEGQEFRFTDSAFGLQYKFTKKGNKWIVADGGEAHSSEAGDWIGPNGYIRTPLITTTKNPNVSFPVQGYMHIKNDHRNRIIIYSCTGYDINEGNPWQYFIEQNKFIEFVGIPNGKSPIIQKYELKDDYYTCVWYYDHGLDEHNDVSVKIKFDGAESSITWQIRPYGQGAKWEYSNNAIEVLKCDHLTNQVECPHHDGLTICTPADCVYALSADIGYEEGTNPFEFLANKCCYTITPRPEACSTLQTTFNIRTSGIVMGQNLESHAFALNSIGNTVDRTVNRVEDIQKLCQDLQNQINELKPKTDWFTILKDTIQIAGGLFSIMRGVSCFATFVTNNIGGIATNSLAIGEAVETELEDVVDGIIKDVDVLAPQNKTIDLDLLYEPITIYIDGESKIICTYGLNYVGNNYKLALMKDELVELVDYDFENKQFNQPKDENVHIEYKPLEHKLTIIGKQYDYVRIEYIKEVLGIGPNDLGDELTNNKILTAKAVKKLIDNNLKQSNEIEALRARIDVLENIHKLEADKELDKQIVLLETKCKNIYSTLDKTGVLSGLCPVKQSLSFEDRIELLESKCENIDVELDEESEPETLQERVQVLQRKCVNLL